LEFSRCDLFLRPGGEIPVKKWQDVIDEKLPGIGPVDDKFRQLVKRESNRYRGSIRLSIGRFYTDKEFTARKQKNARMKLP